MLESYISAFKIAAQLRYSTAQVFSIMLSEVIGIRHDVHNRLRLKYVDHYVCLQWFATTSKVTSVLLITTLGPEHTRGGDTTKKRYQNSRSTVFHAPDCCDKGSV
jgi:hypothetical protein